MFFSRTPMIHKVHYEFSCAQNYILIKTYHSSKRLDKTVNVMEYSRVMIISEDEKPIEFPLLSMPSEFNYSEGICHEITPIIEIVFREYLGYRAVVTPEPLLTVPSQINGKKNKVIRASRESLEVPVSLLVKWIGGWSKLVIAPGLWVKMISGNKKMVIAMIKEKVEGISIGS